MCDSVETVTITIGTRLAQAIADTPDGPGYAERLCAAIREQEPQLEDVFERIAILNGEHPYGYDLGGEG